MYANQQTRDPAVNNDLIVITQMLKATPVMEGAQRFVYMEASNEKPDQQEEIVLAEALQQSADWFLRYGNLDIDHVTMVGAKLGIPDYNLFEIGQPVSCATRGGLTFVKGRIYSGDGPAAQKANDFWSSIVDLKPPQRWYPSVGGDVLERGPGLHAETKSRRTFVRKVRWRNIGFSKTPVNDGVPTVATVPFGALAKSFVAGYGYDMEMAKALTAGYGTDSASLEGGAALRTQSLDRPIQNYWDFRNHLAADVRANIVRANGGAQAFAAHASKMKGVSPDNVGEWVERFMGDLSRKRSRAVH